MKKSDIISLIFQEDPCKKPAKLSSSVFAPTNIALCKYWGKRDEVLNLPYTQSLSITLPKYGTWTTIHLIEKPTDQVILEEKILPLEHPFSQRLIHFLDLFRPLSRPRFRIEIHMNIPLAAGLASSASGFASFILGLTDLFAWGLSLKELSILARLGSGSAARSFWQGFVKWNRGVRPDGMDSFAEPLTVTWPELCLGILILNKEQKKISSREAMQRTVLTSPFYKAWPHQVEKDFGIMVKALEEKNFPLLGATVESNALAMHATMLTSHPPICYIEPKTLVAMQKVWELRLHGLPLFFTQDAGPNLKLLFLKQNQKEVEANFPTLKSVQME